MVIGGAMAAQIIQLPCNSNAFTVNCPGGEPQCYDTGPNGQTYPVSNGGKYEWYGHQSTWDLVLGGGCRIENLGYPS